MLDLFEPVMLQGKNNQKRYKLFFVILDVK